jgi:serine protease Do
MKKALRKLPVLALGLALAAPVSLLAQKEDKDEKDKKDVEQIIITRKGDKDEKMVVEIIGDKITVNGKPVEEGKSGDVTVMRNRIKDFRALALTQGRNRATGVYNFNDMSQLLNTDENKAMLGVTTERTDEGAEIQVVTKESAAEKAGLKKGDIITKIGDKKIEDADDLSTEIRKQKPGDKISITYLRDKKEAKVNAELTKWKGVRGFNYGTNGDLKLDFDGLDFYKSMPRGQSVPRVRVDGHGVTTVWNSGAPKLGLSVQDSDDGKGVKVIEVDDEGNAAKAGIEEDDVITEVDGKAVNGADEVAKIIKESKDKISVKIKLIRDGKTQNLDVKIPRKLKTADL